MNLNGVHFDEGPVTEDPKLGTTEGWVYVNLTADTNPMHYPSRHLPGRRTDTVRRPSLRGSQRRPTRRPRRNRPDPVRDRPNAPARPDRTRLQGHSQVNPGYFTTIRAKFDLPAGVSAPQTYVHHCHIVEHEDNDMMRPLTVEP